MQDDVRVRFGERLRELRRARRMSQEELAFRSGLTQTYLSQVEKGQRNISLVNIEKLAKALGVSLRVLMPEDIRSPSTRDEGPDQVPHSGKP